jgi:hypothetical protein
MFGSDTTKAGVRPSRRHLVRVLAFAAGLAAASPVFAEDVPDEGWLNVIFGNYALIGQQPGDGETYAGTARIDRVGDDIVLDRRIGGRLLRATGRLDLLHESTVLRVRWEDGGTTAMMVCLLGSDLDNYGRLTCTWDAEGAPRRARGREALFSTDH